MAVWLNPEADPESCRRHLQPHSTSWRLQAQLGSTAQPKAPWAAALEAGTAAGNPWAHCSCSASPPCNKHFSLDCCATTEVPELQRTQLGLLALLAASLGSTGAQTTGFKMTILQCCQQAASDPEWHLVTQGRETAASSLQLWLMPQKHHYRITYQCDSIASFKILQCSSSRQSLGGCYWAAFL